MNERPTPTDRVTELYRGEIFTAETQRICRERIHWMCSQAAGERVLDVGCSQGIASILLAQEGFEVTGVDVDPAAIEFARAELRTLSEQAASNATFVLTDLATQHLDLGPFDTALLGEFLEHFAQPRKVLDRCLSLLREGGRIVITVPFGVHPHKDHRFTFTLSSLVELVMDRVHIRKLDVVDGYIRLAGDKAGSEGIGLDSTQAAVADLTLLTLTEKGLLSSQNRLYGLIEHSRTTAAELRKAREDWRKRAQKAEAQSRTLDKTVTELSNGLSELRAAISTLEGTIESENATTTELKLHLNQFHRECRSMTNALKEKERTGQDISETQERICDLERKVQRLSSPRADQAGPRCRKSPAARDNPSELEKSARSLLKRFHRRLKRRVLPPLPAHQIKRTLSDVLKKQSPEAAEARAARLTEQRRASELTIAKIMFSLMKESYANRALPYGERALQLDPENRKLARVLATRYRRVGDHLRSDELLRLAFGGGSLSTSRPPGSWAFSEVREALQRLIEEEGFEAAEAWCEVAQSNGWAGELQLNRILFALTRRSEPVRSLTYGERALAIEPDEDLRQALASQYRTLGRIRRAFELSEDSATPGAAESRSQSFLRGQLELLDQGYRTSHPRVKRYESKPSRVLYLLHNSLPHSSGGYATRSHALALAVRQAEVDLEVVTRLGFPLDLKHLTIENAPSEEVLDEVPYFRLLGPEPGYGVKPLPQYLDDYTNRVVGFAQQRRPFVLHAASNFMNGVVANAAATALAVPSIYEVRGLWEITRLSRQPEWEGSEYFSMLKRMETQAAREATAVIAITNALKHELVRRGVQEDKITVVPNAVNPERFQPLPKDQALAARLGLADKVVIGYVGSLVDYEGLDLLLQAAVVLRDQKVPDFALLIVGDGAAMRELQSLTARLSLDALVHFTGRVPHSEVERYYSLMDILPYPRKPLPVCEMVSPIKPFEAMSMEKAVVSSDVAALSEIVSHGTTGLLHRKGDVTDLAARLAQLIEDGKLRRDLGENARRWVIEERSWRSLAPRVRELYVTLGLDTRPILS